MTAMISRRFALAAVAVLAGLGVPARTAAQTSAPRNPDTAPQAVIDRFSPDAGTLQVRTATNGLPGPNEPVDFDSGPFVTQGLAADGTPVRYYNFDVQGTAPAPIYVLVREGEEGPVAGQLNIVDVIPGDEGYNDFWQVVEVTVPAEYAANTVTSLREIRDAGWPMEVTRTLVNCPIVPRGSTAEMRLRGGNADLHRGWYRGQVVFYFTFEERPLQTTPAGAVPVSPIYVTFAINPDKPGGGPASGFVTEPDSPQTHNVVQTVPADADYSPLWLVNVYDNADFARVRDLGTAREAKLLATAAALVNCPVVQIGRGT